MPSICKLLLQRERGAKTITQIETIAQVISEKHIVSHCQIPQSVNNIPDSSRSVFAIEFSHDGSLAAVSHTNRTVSLINVANMRKVSEIQNDRTVWTLEFHPSDKRILAMGTFAGRVSIHKDGVSVYRIRC
jgi:WD40 repeat protein